MKDYIDPPSSLKPGAVVWAYLRDSGGDNQERSVDQQRAEVEAYCSRHGLVLGIVFADVARSGGSVVGRERFNDMIDMSSLSDALPAGLLIWNQARFSRDLDDSSYYKAVLRKRGIVVHSLTDPIPEGQFGRAVEVLIDIANEERRRQISRDTKRALTALVKLGFASGGFPPRGYKAEAVTIGHKRDGSPRIVSRWVPDPELWELVKLAWELRAKGKTYHEIQEATGRRVYKSKSCWVTFFCNKTYLGIGKCGSLEVENHHEPAVTRETWEIVQAVQRASPRFGIADHPHNPRRAGLPSLLSGLAVCLYCGASIGFHHKAWPSYVCRRKEREGYQSCRGRIINARSAEAAVLDAVLGRVLTVDYLQALLEETRANFNDEAGLDKEIERLRAFQAANERKIENLLRIGEENGPEVVRERLAARLGERGRLAVELMAAEERRLAVEKYDISAEAFGLVVETWRDQVKTAREVQDVRRLQELLRLFITRLELGYNTGRITYSFPIEAAVWPYHPVERWEVGGTNLFPIPSSHS